MRRQPMTYPTSKAVQREYVTTSPTTTGYVVRPHVTHVVEPRVTYVQEPRTYIEYVPQITYVAQERTTYETVPRTEYETKSYATYDVQPIREQQTIMVEQEVPVYYQGATEQVVYGEARHETPWKGSCCSSRACCHPSCGVPSFCNYSSSATRVNPSATSVSQCSCNCAIAPTYNIPIHSPRSSFMPYSVGHGPTPSSNVSCCGPPSSCFNVPTCCTGPSASSPYSSSHQQPMSYSPYQRSCCPAPQSSPTLYAPRV